MLADYLIEFDEPHAPGTAAMIIADGRVREVFVCGLADLEAGSLITKATNFRLASVSKQFTAMAVLMLSERGALSLDDDVRRHLPELPAFLAGTRVRHLLNHTSGLRDYEDLVAEGTTRQLSDADVLAMLADCPTRMFDAGSAYHYSNSGYALLAMIVERAGRADFAEFLRAEIFEPLDMRATCARRDGGMTVPFRAYGYSRRDGRFVRTDQSVTSAVLGDGGIYSSLVDLFKWDQALYTERLVRADTAAQAFTPSVKLPDGSAGYGFGWYVRQRGADTVAYHTGESIGFRNAYERCPARGLSVVVLTNRSNQRVPAIAAAMMNELLAES